MGIVHGCCTWNTQEGSVAGICSAASFTYTPTNGSEKPKCDCSSLLQKDAAADLLSKGQGAPHSLPSGCEVMLLLIHPEAQGAPSPSCLLHTKMDSDTKAKDHLICQNLSAQVSLTLRWTQSSSHPQLGSICPIVRHHSSRMGQSFIAYEAGKHK